MTQVNKVRLAQVRHQEQERHLLRIIAARGDVDHHRLFRRRQVGRHVDHKQIVNGETDQQES